MMKRGLWNCLYPFALLYGLGVQARNWMFDKGFLKSKSYQAPVLSVGNLTVGGTGKTPHTEYLIRLLGLQFRVATLSRGYRRKSRGFVLAKSGTELWEIGDEPMQLHCKYPEAQVAVDENRCEGIERLLALKDNQGRPSVDVVLLDDAYQHRYVKPGLQILLTDYHRPIYEDALLPAGRLREPVRGKERADIIIVTKCPREHFKESDALRIRSRLKPTAHQELYFTTMRYGMLKSFVGDEQCGFSAISEADDVLLVTGIANPKPLIEHLRKYTSALHTLIFADHHNFTAKDISRINGTFSTLRQAGRNVMLVTTEKDATRLSAQGKSLSEELKKNCYVCPIEIDFLHGGGEAFNNKIISYVRKNSRNGVLVEP